jgi:16S rRNA (guanine(966)-N(2))-methyltransferase RsmD
VVLRIIGGKAKGRRLAVPRHEGPQGHSIRPTPERVREALFSILGEEINGARFLDVFAGTGALSAEALSRGASCAVLLEQGREALQLIAKNLESAGFSKEDWEVMVGDALASLRKLSRAGRRFDIVYLDPPYASEIGESVLFEVAPLLAPEGIAILEHASRSTAPVSDLLRVTETRKFGDTSISFYQSKEQHT